MPEPTDIRIKRLSGPKTHICWTPDHTPIKDRTLVTLVKENDLAKLEDICTEAQTLLRRIVMLHGYTEEMKSELSSLYSKIMVMKARSDD